MKTITLTQGYVALVSDRDYARCMTGPKWYGLVTKRNVYAMRKVYTAGKGHAQMLHRFILGIPDPNVQVDHFPDPSGLNNMRSNLRLAMKVENSRNRRLNINNTSGFKGVFWDKGNRKWRAQIKVDGKFKHLGYFADKREAARAYDVAALKCFGRFACTNASLGLLPEIKKPPQAVQLNRSVAQRKTS